MKLTTANIHSLIRALEATAPGTDKDGKPYAGRKGVLPRALTAALRALGYSDDAIRGKVTGTVTTKTGKTRKTFDGTGMVDGWLRDGVLTGSLGFKLYVPGDESGTDSAAHINAALAMLGKMDAPKAKVTRKR